MKTFAAFRFIWELNQHYEELLWINDNINKREDKTRHVSVGKVIDWKLSKKFKSEHTSNCCIPTIIIMKSITMVQVQMQ